MVATNPHSKISRDPRSDSPNGKRDRGVNRKFTKRTRRNLITGLLFIAPWIVGFLAFTAYPMVSSLIISFYDYRLLQGFAGSEFVGLDNYVKLFSDSDYRVSLVNTLYMVVLSVPLGLLCSFLCAVILNFKIRGQGIFRTIYYLPSIVPAVASTFLFIFLLNPEIGLVNGALRLVGIEGPNWIRDPLWSKPGMILLGLWGIGGTIVIYLAGITDIAPSLFEAAELDGATYWQRLIYITIPMLSPLTLYNLIIGVIAVFQFFGSAYLWAKGANGGGLGAPLKSTLFYSIYLFQNAIERVKMGYAAAMAWVLFFIVLGCTVLLLKTSNRWTNYDN
jgi:multiple sugar transport system permease protein